MRLIHIFVAFCLWFCLSSAQAGTPQVVVSIKPLHSLAAAVMADVGEPTLLLSGGESVHSYSMRPSDARAVRGADLVVYVSPQLEAFLEPSLEARNDQSGNLAAAQLEGIRLLDARRADDWHEGEEAAAGHGHSHKHKRDYHLWLDPHNARVIARAMAERLAELDAANAEQYRRNARELEQRLRSLDEELERRVEQVRDRPYVVFHDAYQYFERSYGLESAGVVTLTPEQRPGGRHLLELRNQISELGVACVFVEPQFKPAIVRSLTRGLDVSIGELDPIGADLDPGPEAYFELLEGLADGLVDCLGQHSE